MQQKIGVALGLWAPWGLIGNDHTSDLGCLREVGWLGFLWKFVTFFAVRLLVVIMFKVFERFFDLVLGA